MNFLDALKRITIIYLVSLIAAVGCMVLVYLLPVVPMLGNIFSDVEILDEEGPYPGFMPEVFERLHSGDYSVRALLLNNRGMCRDNYTDALMLGTAAYDTGDASALESALLNPHGEVVEMWPIGSLKGYFDQGSANLRRENYARYWHGYLVVLKPLLLVTGYSGVKILNLILMGSMLVALLVMIAKRLSWRTAATFGVALFFGFPLQIPFCMQYSSVTYITLVASLVMVSRFDKINASFEKICSFFFLVGILTSFFDLLTFPIWTLGIPMVLFIALSEREKRDVKIKTVIGLSASWGVGYGLFWASKWVLASVFTSENVILDAIRRAEVRSVGDASLTGKKITLFHSIASNLVNYSNIIFLILGLIILVRMIINRKRVRHHINAKAYILTALMPIVWFMVLKSHSFDHSAFTCRGLMVTIMSVVFMFRDIDGVGSE